MGTRLSDSRQYAHLWGTPALAEVFEERARLQRWLDIVVALAVAQARVGIIPQEAADQIAAHARADRLDLDFVASETRRTSHSTLGLINALQDELKIKPGETTSDGKVSLLTARCIGACGIAPAVTYYGQVAPKQTAEAALEKLKQWK